MGGTEHGETAGDGNSCSSPWLCFCLALGQVSWQLVSILHFPGRYIHKKWILVPLEHCSPTRLGDLKAEVCLITKMNYFAKKAAISLTFKPGILLFVIIQGAGSRNHVLWHRWPNDLLWDYPRRIIAFNLYSAIFYRPIHFKLTISEGQTSLSKPANNET